MLLWFYAITISSSGKQCSKSCPVNKQMQPQPLTHQGSREGAQSRAGPTRLSSEKSGDGQSHSNPESEVTTAPAPPPPTGGSTGQGGLWPQPAAVSPGQAALLLRADAHTSDTCSEMPDAEHLWRKDWFVLRTRWSMVIILTDYT